MKATGKIGLVKINLICIRVTSPLFITQDPNFYRARELEPILDSLLIFSHKGTRDVPSFIRGGTEMASKTTQSSDEDNPISRSLDLTSDILSNLATSAKWETKGNKEVRTKVYGQSSPTKELALSGCSLSTDSSKLPK